MACTTLYQCSVTCLLISKEGKDTLSPESHSPPSGSSVSGAVLSRAPPASESMSDTGTLRVDASDFSRNRLGSQLSSSSISRNSSISSSHGFLQNQSEGGPGMKQQSLQPDSTASEKEQQHHCRAECPCITKVLLAYQDINMNLNGRAAISGNVASPYDHHLGALAGIQVLTKKQGTFSDQQQVPVETALHCIKSSLEICEMLMDCQTCSARSECIMLSICMCDTMVARAEELVGAVKPSPSSIGNKVMPGSVPSDQGKIHRRHHCGHHSSDRSAAHSGLRLGQWRLDNEDELQVIQSLLAARMTRLDNLTARMKRVAQQNEWPVHDARIGNMRERLVAAMFMAKRGSFM